MKKVGFVLVGFWLLMIYGSGPLTGDGIYIGDSVFELILAIGLLWVGLFLIVIDSEDEKILQKTGFFLVGLFLLLFPITGFEFWDAYDVIFRVLLLLTGLALIFIGVRSSSVNSTTWTPSRPEHPGPGQPPQPPQPPKVEPPGETLPPGVWKCPVCETFVDNDASACPVCGYSRTQQQ